MANANWWCADVQHVITRRGHEVELLFSELCENQVCELFYLVYGGPRRIFALLSRSGGLLSETRVGVSWYLSRIWKLLRLEGDECIAGHRLIQRPVHQSFGLVKCTLGLVGLAKKRCIW